MSGKCGCAANRSGQWRYRIGNYRILADIRENELVLVFIDVGHRSRIYE
ncbi:type II toxin-antitoxin system RelE/ParE family toxin [Selenomonas sp. TAMA-11512]